MSLPTIPPKSKYSEAELAAFWETALGADSGVALPSAIAQDLSAYTSEPTDVVLQKMANGMATFKALWEERGVDARDAAGVERFYQDQFVEAYELAHWHSGVLNKAYPLNYAYAALLARDLGARRVLDFGSGIGSGVLCFGKAGCTVDAADIANVLLDFVVARARRHNVTVRPIRLFAGEAPQGPYDLIACFDVLEHVPDQRAKLRELEGYLAVGGVLVTNLLQDSTHEDRPMHISSAGPHLPLVRSTGLVPVWSWWGTDLQVLQRTQFGRLRNMAAALRERKGASEPR